MPREPDYSEACRELQRVHSRERTESDFGDLDTLLVSACRRALLWNGTVDFYQTQREKDRLFIEGTLDSAQVAVTKLKRLADDYPIQFDAVVWRAVHATGITPDMLREAGFGQPHAAGGQSGQFVRKLLSELSARIETERKSNTRVAVKGSTFAIHRVVHGPLKFPAPIDGKRMPEARVMGLQFELVFHLKRYSNGKPHFDVVARFV